MPRVSRRRHQPVERGRHEAGGSRRATPRAAAGKAVVSRGAYAPAVIIAAAVIWSALAAFSVTLTWDESIYAGYVARGYIPWLQAVWRGGAASQAWSTRALWSVFEQGQAHPPLGPLAMALPSMLFDGIFPFYICERFASVVWFGIALWAAYRLALRGGGRGAALCGLGALALMPRFFGHSHLAALDMPAAATWTLTALAARLSLRRRRYAPLLGLAWGLALLTKVNALFLPAALVPWLLLCGRRRALWPLACLFVIGPLVMVAGWPSLWHDPVLGIARYLADKAGHPSWLLNPALAAARPVHWLQGLLTELGGKTGRVAIPVLYLGRVYSDPPAPWHYPLVLMIATTPLGILGGAVFFFLRRRVRGWARRPFVLFTALNIAGAVAPFMLPGAPVYDGVRLFLPALPFVAILAGMGLARAWRQVRSRRGWSARRARPAAAAFWAWQVLLLAWMQPCWLSFYGGGVGGVWGAWKLGFETTYWGDTVTAAALDYVNRNAPAHSTVLIGPSGDFVPPYLQYYGQLSPNLKVTTNLAEKDWSYFVLVPRQGMLPDWALRLYREGRPVWEFRIMGVPQCMIFAREPAGSPPAKGGFE